MYRSRKLIVSVEYLFFKSFKTISLASVILSMSCTDHPTDSKHANVKQDPTFVDIAPIIFKNCTPCHRPGESGPFELMSYADAKRNANKIKFVTQTRYMPPWPADPAYSHFIGERVLTIDEIELIRNWVNNGAPEGDKSKMPPAPEFYTGSSLGTPDTVISYSNAVPLKGNGSDHFYIIKLPLTLAKDTFVKYFEFVPDKRKLVHHVNGHSVNYKENAKKTITSGKSYILDEYRDYYQEVYKEMSILNDDGTYPVLTPNTVYYLPGYSPPVYPEGIGGYLMRRTSAILLKSVHYGPSAENVTDSSHINVFYGPKPKRPIYETQLGTFGVSKIEPELIIQPEKIQTFHTQATLDADISLLSVNPHMHLLGKTFWAFALKANGDTIPLVKINKWDFRWQYYYTYKHPVKLPAGTTIHVYGTFDNTSKNPFNPNHPPKVVTQGDGIRSMQTTEEMFQFIFTYLPYQPGDEKIDLERK